MRSDNSQSNWRNHSDLRWNTAGTVALILAALVLLTSAGLASVRTQEPSPPVAGLALLGPKPKKVVIIGDSLTEGTEFGGSGEANWAQQVSRRLRHDGINLNLVVAGRGGAGYAVAGHTGTDFAEEVDRLVQPDDDLVVIFGGTNDWPYPLDSVAPAVVSTLSEVRVRAPNAEIIVVGPVWPSPQPNAQLEALRDVAREESTRIRAVFIDPLANGWFRNEPEFIGTDGIHPTDAGHLFIAEALYPVIRSALTSSPAQN